MSSITIGGMSCQHCVAAVTRAMRAVPDAGEVNVDLAGGKATWTGGAPASAMAAAVRDQGYEVKEN